MKQQLITTFLTSCVLLLMVTTAFGQGTVKGIVKDSARNEILYGSEVRLNNAAGEMVGGAASDFMDGIYTIEAPAGSYTIEVTYMGYAAYRKEIVLKDGDDLEMNINMVEEANMLQVTTVTGSKFETPVGKTTISLDVVKPSLVDNTNATKVDEVVDKVPGVTVVDGQANIRGGSGYSYGAGSRVLLLVDDLPLLTGDAGQPNWRDIPVENISQIEVVKGAASAMYGSSALNGIINIRTAYATNKPFTKISLFQTSFLTPRRESTAWWLYPSIKVWNADGNGDNEPDTVSASLLSGTEGYRTPMEMGIQAAHRQKFGKLDLTLGANYYYQDSYRAGQFERKFRFNANTRYRFSTKFNAGINVNLNTGSSASFFIWGNQNFYGNGILGAEIDTAIYIPLDNTITQNQNLRFNVDPFFTAYDNHEGRHRLQTRYYYVNNQNLQNQSNLSHLVYGEYQYQRKFKIESTFFGSLDLVAGAVGMYTFSESELFGNARYDIANAAGYAQVSQGLFKEKDSENSKLNITFGMRLEYNSIKSPEEIIVNPVTLDTIQNPEPLSQEAKPVFRVGLNYEITKITFLRASWGQGYRYPTIAERYITTLVGSGSNSLAIRANPELQSETGFSAEIGLKQGFKIGKFKGFLDFSGFWTEYQNMMEFSFGGGRPETTNLTNIYFQSVNIGDTRILGFEGSVMGTGKVGPVKFNVLGGYTYISPTFQNWSNDSVKARIQALSTSDENLLKYRAVHTAKFDIEAFIADPLKNDISVGFSLNYASEMANIDNAFEDIIYDTPQNQYQDDIFGIANYRANFNRGEYIEMGARIGYRYRILNPEGQEKAAIKFSVVGKNLLNQEYMIRPALVAAPANFTVRIDVEF